MTRRISMAGRTELLEAVSAPYGGATWLERSRILDEFAAMTGYHRKHAIRLLAGWGEQGKVEPHTDNLGRAEYRRGRHGPEVRDAPIQLCKVADRVCSKPLQPMFAVLLPPLERHGRVTLNEATRVKLQEVSAATIDRLLAEVRLVAGSGRRRQALAAPSHWPVHAAQTASKPRAIPTRSHPIRCPFIKAGIASHTLKEAGFRR